MGTGASFADAFAKAQLAAGDPPPRSGTLLISVRDVDKPGAVALAAKMVGLGFDLAATGGTADALEAAGLAVRRVKKVLEGRPHIVDMIKNDEADIIVNTTEGRRAIADSAPIRASAEAHRRVLHHHPGRRRGGVPDAAARGRQDRAPPPGSAQEYAA
jgi:carbamoyl-phosphate synthase large subunit